MHLYFDYNTLVKSEYLKSPLPGLLNIFPS